ncbi:hypothetical protein O181_111264 [Austropuccinia psidii MF-1]|uniref:Transposase Tc1-like domain-containing protein n=1 Tax=Austropuccinia psidii MF-1 TaxID=1389203 RepID=A0A9Q3PRM5_9BASI|nr:hypothetical protein [Austropuccinia psidii MF-1]
MKLNDRDWQQLSRIITQYQRLTVSQVASLMTFLVSTQTIQREIHKLGKHSQIAPKKPYFQRQLAFAQAHRHWTDELAFELGKRVDQVRVWCMHNHFLGWSHEFARNGPTGLPPCSSPLHRANGASPGDKRLTSPPANGRQCANLHGSFQKSMTQTKWGIQDGVSSTFTRPQSNRKYLEIHEKPNSKALPTSKFGGT